MECVSVSMVMGGRWLTSLEDEPERVVFLLGRSLYAKFRHSTFVLSYTYICVFKYSLANVEMF